MKQFIFCAAFLLIITGGQCPAQGEAADVFVRANEAYTQQNFEQAVELYESVLTQGKESGPLYYNLGNTYFRIGKIGKAVLNYERALMITPRDSALRANYRYAKSFVGKAEGEQQSVFFLRFLKDIFTLYTFNEICRMILLLIFLLSCVHLCGLYFHWKPGRRVAALLVIGGIVVFYAVGLFWKMQNVFGRAVVLSASSAYFEPREGATVHFSLFEGDNVKILSGDGSLGWSKVRRFDGKVGWVNSEDVEEILIKRRKLPVNIK